MSQLIFEKDKSELRKCTKCSLVFIWPPPPVEKINKNYQDHGVYYLNQDKIEIAFASSYSDRLKRIKPYRFYNRILDVGCSTGAFLKAAKINGWNTWGVEISKLAADYAKDKENLNVFCGSLAEAHFQDNFFDIVNIWAVLEHVPDPLEMVSESRRILRKGGGLVINVPNFESLPIKLIGKKYRYIQKEHLFYFSKKSIKEMFKKTQFKIVDITSDYFSPLTFYEDFLGIPPDTLKTDIEERKLKNRVQEKKFLRLFSRQIWKSFMFFIKRLYLGEELRVMAVKK
jgi:SAM-dependent methyltransferase